MVYKSQCSKSQQPSCLLHFQISTEFLWKLHSKCCCTLLIAKSKNFLAVGVAQKICLYHYLICGLLLQTQAHKVSKVGTKVPTYKRPGCLAACWEWTIHWCESQTILEFFFIFFAELETNLLLSGSKNKPDMHFLTIFKKCPNIICWVGHSFKSHYTCTYSFKFIPKCAKLIITTYYMVDSFWKKFFNLQVSSTLQIS